MKQPTLFETGAARIVAAQTGCLCLPLDPGGGGVQLPDYELQNGKGERLGILEVTSVIVGELLAFDSANAKFRMKDERLRCAWFLVMRGNSVNHSQLMKELPALLLELEKQNFMPLTFDLNPGYNFREGDEPFTSLNALGVWILSALPGAKGTPGSIYIKPKAQGGAIGPPQVTQAVQKALDKEDNRKKLAPAVEDKRAELFVWLDADNGGMALVTPRLFPDLPSGYPTDGPTLPAGVTRVWAGTGPNDRDVLARGLWMAEGGNWIVIDPLPARLDL